MKIKSKLEGIIPGSPKNDVNSNSITVDKIELLLMAMVLTEQTIPDDDVPLEVILNNLEKGGYKRLESNIALRSLKTKKLISLYNTYDEKRNVKFSACRITKMGENWVLNNREDFNKLNINFNNKSSNNNSEDTFSESGKKANTAKSSI